jgi:hypothetical protein
MGPTQAGRRSYYFRLEKCDLKPIMERLQKQGFEVVDAIP